MVPGRLRHQTDPVLPVPKDVDLSAAATAAAADWRIDPDEPIERVESWGRALRSNARVVHATSVATIRRVFEVARRGKRSVALRGAGCSYSDAFQNEGGFVLDTAGMNRVIAYDRERGTITGGPGLTIAQIWRTTLADGWWPPVVTGTMFASLGGLAAMNAHGKNNFKRGTVGDQILAFTILVPTGEEIRCSREENSDLFHAAIGGFGMLGCFTSVTLQLKRVHSGLLEVEPIVCPNVGHMLETFERRKAESDYLVGWLDAFATGSSLGRGIIHRATYLHGGEDPHPELTMNPASQELPPRILGVFPKGWMWIFLRPFVNDLGMRAINAAKYLSARMHADEHTYRQSLAAFSFLLDYVPGWKLSYGPGGLIQYQPFVPAARAHEVFSRLLRESQRWGIVPYLLVMKRHRPDPFLLTHAVDGFSLAMDYRVTDANRKRLWRMAAEFDPIVLDAGGRFYFAKDATLSETSVARIWPRESVDRFLALKRRCDPDGLLETNLLRRCFGERAASAHAED